MILIINNIFVTKTQVHHVGATINDKSADTSQAKKIKAYFLMEVLILKQGAESRFLAEHRQERRQTKHSFSYLSSSEQVDIFLREIYIRGTVGASGTPCGKKNKMS